MPFELTGVAYEATGSEEGLDEVDDAVGAAVLPLAVGKDPVESPPFRGLAGVIFEAPVSKGTGDLISRAAFSEQSGKRLDLAFREWRDDHHLGDAQSAGKSCWIVVLSGGRFAVG